MLFKLHSAKNVVYYNRRPLNMTGNTELFSRKSDDYSRFRPAYPDAALAWLRAKTSGETVLDVGAGTGIFTRQLLKYFSDVAAVEPNADMREKFRAALPELRCLDTTGEDTGVAANSVDLITVAQAFHWLDAGLFKSEAQRILRPDGQAAIVWNTSLKSDFTIARNRVCQKYCPRFHSGHAGQHSVEEGDAFLRNEYFRKVEVVSFDNPFVMDLEIFEGNMRSRSYALTPMDADYDRFMMELREVFEKFASCGTVIEPQETQIYFGTF